MTTPGGFMTRDANIHAQECFGAAVNSGKLIERWGSSDRLGRLTQPGLAPKP
ncbi:hypothetical protein ACQCSX_11615 [Pseudarthrobacter sp. P1]|uniref:hypothetical protein n=1 Tax=Pseudarthrobacter sp. P1 TaxID=3418418 RepID=UPI003CF44E4B